MEKLRIAQVGTGHPHAKGQTDTILANPEFDLIGFAEPSPEYRHPESAGFEAPSTPSQSFVTPCLNWKQTTSFCV